MSIVKEDRRGNGDEGAAAELAETLKGHDDPAYWDALFGDVPRIDSPALRTVRPDEVGEAEAAENGSQLGHDGGGF